MTSVPDAPWIRDAENNGMEDYGEPVCPVCGAECERFYFYAGDRDVLGCDRCIDWDEAWIIKSEEG